MRLSLLRNCAVWLVMQRRILLLLFIGATCEPMAVAQPPNQAIIAPVNAPNAAILGPNIGATAVQPGGSADADFDSLIDLIVSTVSTETWAENGGGEAEIRPFFGGVFVDTGGMLRERVVAGKSDLSTTQAEVPRTIATPTAEAKRAGSGNGLVHQSSRLRFVSLPRLEREIGLCIAKREALDQAMLTLAGLQRVRYVILYPETGDLVLAGPAGDWQIDGDGRIVSVDTGLPIVRLDDLLVLLRRGDDGADSFFGCSINPRQESLARTQAFLSSSNQKPLQPGQRNRWLTELRNTVGQQDIDVFGIDPASRIASVLVKADFHMKLIGMGLAEGVEGVDSYLDAVKLASAHVGAPPPALSVLRWWFALHYDAIVASPSRDAFELVGQGAQVLSENELLAARGERVHTGQSDPLNQQFADSFTEHFAVLAAKYPIYVELRNIFDLAVAMALIHSESFIERAGWKPSLFASSELLRLPNAPVPREVETVINHRVINRRQIVAGVSGGVLVAPSDMLNGTRSVTKDLLKPLQPAASGSWWWDAGDR